ncbi:MAG: carbamoyltransferase HypF, partial [Candidatus Marinimicrobia bacterium]|nr:carbamoyltransferase HypF [Candidatus Neomarinimicrobiota bacterium]
DSAGVTIIVQGSNADIAFFEAQLCQDPPHRSKIVDYQSEIIFSDNQYLDFEIRLSPSNGSKTAAISPDLDVCDDCRHEMYDPENRRYLYPFINCMNCGPRYTIIKDIPYDRPKTTMTSFQMCQDCQAEYDDPGNRRFHAQPNACPVCGPHLELRNASGQVLVSACESEEYGKLFKQISILFADGNILAIKGIGGYHFACDATNETAVSALRSRKYREDKPFAVMFPDIGLIKKFCKVTLRETELLESVAHPIVLLKKKKSFNLSNGVAPNNHFLGAMLPYTPLHFLIFHYYNKPLVMTSANVSDEPIAFKDNDALERLKTIADYYLVHNREIHIRCDDSVIREFAGKIYPVRRSRGYAPEKLIIDWEFTRHVLACGPEQKNTFTMAKNNAVHMSHHIGDMENLEVLNSFEKGINHYQHIFDIHPEIVAYDLHPDYLSTKFAHDYAKTAGLKEIGIQHHHAHAVSCMVDNKINKPVLSIILDGTGYGIDGTVWGGELLLAEYNQFKRLGHFRIAYLPGGSAAIKNPWQMGISYLFDVFGSDLVDIPFLQNLEKDKVTMIIKMLENRFNSPVTSSCGRLFDGVAAIAGLRNFANYEGQSAVEFEQCIHKNDDSAYEFRVIDDRDTLILDWKTMIHQLVYDIKENNSLSYISQKFHNGLARGLTLWAEIAQKSTGISDVVLSGGVFMNIYLLRRLKKSLEKKGFNVYTHSVVPCNDGGISLGQVVIADAQMKNTNLAG